MHIISDVTCGPVPGSYDNARAEYDIFSTPEVKHFITRKPCPPDNKDLCRLHPVGQLMNRMIHTKCQEAGLVKWEILQPDLIITDALIFYNS
ncbi:hypothetical protein BgiBS90_000336, partial [Biomphalaria glabrata]